MAVSAAPIKIPDARTIREATIPPPEFPQIYITVGQGHALPPVTERRPPPMVVYRDHLSPVKQKTYAALAEVIRTLSSPLLSGHARIK
jgi:hypothetical protein